MWFFNKRPEINGDRLIRLPLEDTKANYLRGFWEWVHFLAEDDYTRALQSLYWPNKAFTPKQLKNRITRFWGGAKPWSVVVPNQRLIQVIEAEAQFSPRNETQDGWFLAQIPVTTEPSRPKDDDIPLQGVAVSFSVREREASYVLALEIFHA